MEDKEYLYFEFTFFSQTEGHMVDMYRAPAGMTMQQRAQYWIDCVEQHTPIAMVFQPGGICIFVRREGTLIVSPGSENTGVLASMRTITTLICAGPAGHHYHLLGLEDVPHIITGLEQPE